MVAFGRECKGNDVAPDIKVAFGRECRGNDVAPDIKVAFGRECKGNDGVPDIMVAFGREGRGKASVVGLDVLVIGIPAEDGGRDRESKSIWKLAGST